MTDVRAYRPYSGFYWQIAELDAKDAVKPLVESRSIWDSNLAVPAGIGAAAAATPGTSVYFDTTDPLGKRLHAAAQVGSIPGRNKPVLFMADHPLTGGYPVIAAVASHHLDLAAQIPIGCTIRFRVLAA